MLFIFSFLIIFPIFADSMKKTGDHILRHTQFIYIWILCGIMVLPSCCARFNASASSGVPMTGELSIGTRVYDVSALLTVHDHRTVEVYIRDYTAPLRIIKPKPEEIRKLSSASCNPEEFKCAIKESDRRFVRIEYEPQMISFRRGGKTLYATPQTEIILLLVDAEGKRQTIYLKGEDQMYYGLDNAMDYYNPLISKIYPAMDRLREDDSFWQW